MAHPSFQSLKMLPPSANKAKLQKFQRALTLCTVVLTIERIGHVAITKSGVDSLLLCLVSGLLRV